MKTRNSRLLRTLALAAAPLALAACKGKTVSYAEDVKPILDQYCLECHQEGGQGQVASGLSMENYASLMRGTHNGPMIVPGDSLGSNLVVLIEGRADPSIQMPHGRNRIPQPQIDLIKAWIDQGARDN